VKAAIVIRGSVAAEAQQQVRTCGKPVGNSMVWIHSATQ
jgi:hypothetical protein